MSALAPVLVYSDGLANRVAIYRVLSTNTGDTADVGTEFKKIIST